MNVCSYLDSSFPTEVNDEGLINYFACTGNALNIKKKASRILKDLFQSDDFRNRFYEGAKLWDLLDQWLGSHSFRKCAAMHSCCNGCNRDEINLRSQWKHQKNQVDMYVDTAVPHPDVKVDIALCLGGSVRYNQVIGLGMDYFWVL